MTFSKHFTTFAAIALSTTVLTATSALGRDTVIGLSPFQEPADLQSQIESSIMHLAETLEPGEIGLFFDAANSRLIGSFEVPEGASYSNTRARIQAKPKPSLYLNWEDWLPFFENPDVPLADKRSQIEALWTIVMCFADADYDILGPDDFAAQETSGQVVDLTAVMHAAVVGLEGSEIQTKTSKEEV